MAAKIVRRHNRVVEIECLASQNKQIPPQQSLVLQVWLLLIKLLTRAHDFNKNLIIDKNKYKWDPPNTIA